MSLLELFINETKEKTQKDTQLVVKSKKGEDIKNKILCYSDFKTKNNEEFTVPGNDYSIVIYYHDYANYKKGGIYGNYKVLFRIEESLQVITNTCLYNKNTIFIGIDNIEYLERLLKKIRLIT
jgi:hypothetical protein